MSVFFLLLALVLSLLVKPHAIHGAPEPDSEPLREPFSAPLDPNQGRLKRPPNMDFYGSHPATLPGKEHPHDDFNKEREISKDEIMAQLRSQGVKEENIEKMAEDIMVENKKNNIESHDHDPNTIHEDTSKQRLNDVSMDDLPHDRIVDLIRQSGQRLQLLERVSPIFLSYFDVTQI